jgi:hypothetical protein
VVLCCSSSVFDLVFDDRIFPSPSELFVCVVREQDALYLMRSI